MSQRLGFDIRRLRVRGLLRVMVFFTLVSAISFCALLKNARAAAEKRMQELGLNLLTQLGPLVLDEPAAMRINGQQMFIASTVTELGAQEVMARMEAYCHEHSGGLKEALLDLPSRVEDRNLKQALRNPEGWFTLRSDPSDDELGQIVCFARKDKTTFEGFLQRFSRLLDSGDISELGDMRYVVARGVRDKTTHVLASWTQGKFNITKMFPETGDAPGADSPNVPRPPDSVRLLSAEVDGQPYSAHVYESRRSPGEVLAFYDESMKIRGFDGEAVWKEKLGEKGLTATPSYGRAFTKDGAIVIMSAIIEPVYQEGTQVSFVEIGTRGTASVVAGAPVVP